MTDEPLLDIKQAALFLNVSETSLRRWTNDGRLACLRVGGRHERRFRRADLVAFLERQPARSLIAAGVGGSRSTGPTVDAPQGFHMCGLCGSDLDRVEMVAAFLAANGVGRARCYILAREDVRSAILARVEETKPAGGVPGGDWTFIACDVAPTVEDQYSYFETQLADAEYSGVDSVLVVSDMWALVGTLGMAGLMAYEAGYAERIARRFPVATLCLYDVRRFSGSDLLEALRRHRDLFRNPDSGALA